LDFAEQLKMVAEWTKGSKEFPAYSQVYRRHFQVNKRTLTDYICPPKTHSREDGK